MSRKIHLAVQEVNPSKSGNVGLSGEWLALEIRKRFQQARPLYVLALIVSLLCAMQTFNCSHWRSRHVSLHQIYDICDSTQYPPMRDIINRINLIRRRLEERYRSLFCWCSGRYMRVFVMRQPQLYLGIVCCQTGPMYFLDIDVILRRNANRIRDLCDDGWCTFWMFPASEMLTVKALFFFASCCWCWWKSLYTAAALPKERP